MDPDDIGDEMRRSQDELHQLIATASHEDLLRPTNGTRWANRQLLFHMVLGYGVVQTLLPWCGRSAASATAEALPPP